MTDKNQHVAKPLCFVIGPIGSAGTDIRKHADMILHGLIKHVLEADEFGYFVKRADDDARSGMINDRIIHDIINAELVVADLTGLNPNVFYELGIRHSRGKPTIHVAKAGTLLPFDNYGHDTIFVDVTDWHDLAAQRVRLAASAKAVRAEGYVVSNPITQANLTFAMRESADPKEQMIIELRDEVSNIKRSLSTNSFSPKVISDLSYVNGARINLFNSMASQIYKQNGPSTETTDAVLRLASSQGIPIENITVNTEWLSYDIVGRTVAINYSPLTQ